METGIKVGDVMQSRLISLDSESTVLEAAKLMKKNNIGSVLVEISGRISGIVTHTDLVERCLAEGRSSSCRLKEVMTKPLVGVEPDADISDAAKLMGNEDLRRLVVFKSDRIVGIISEKDIIKISPSLYDLIAEKVEGHLR
ncbi:MAG: CBS domain-containing protein [Candidatus Micrarchaeota archaeon]